MSFVVPTLLLSAPFRGRPTSGLGPERRAPVLKTKWSKFAFFAPLVFLLFKFRVLIVSVSFRSFRGQDSSLDEIGFDDPSYVKWVVCVVTDDRARYNRTVPSRGPPPGFGPGTLVAIQPFVTSTFCPSLESFAPLEKSP